MHGSNKRAHLWENSKALHKGLRDLGFTLGTETPQSAIIAVIMPDLEKGATMWEALLEEGLYVNLARPPATPAGMTLLRCSLCAEHSSDHVAAIPPRPPRPPNPARTPRSPPPPPPPAAPRPPPPPPAPPARPPP